MGNLNYVTKEGYKKLKDELHRLKSIERPKCSQAIAEARDKGDLSENAEYDAAKEAQGLLELRISKLDLLLQNTRIIDETKLDFSKVQIMSKVKLKNLQNGGIVEYSIVSESESNIKELKISVSTPIAKGLIGKSVGDKVDVKVPAGVIKFEILDISPMD